MNCIIVYMSNLWIFTCSYIFPHHGRLCHVKFTICFTSAVQTVHYMTFIAPASVFLDAVQAASVQLELQDVLVRTGLKDRSRLLLGPFSCSTSLEARWCRHSGSPVPEPGPPKLLLDLKGGLLQVCIPMTWIQHPQSQDLWPSNATVCRGQGQISTFAPG